jgi:serine/threonine protein kinase
MKCPKCHSDNPSDSKYCKDCGTQMISSEEIPVSPTETLVTFKEELATGSIFAGRYQIIEELGKGGMGRVYKVLDKDIEEKVALKLINPEIAARENTIKRFSNELKFARKIRHKNVCQMFDLGKYAGTHYITMEYVEGENLKSSIRRMGPLRIEKAISIAENICAGLSEAHRLGVIHRDLKSSNIMIDKEGNGLIMDFGIACHVEAEEITEEGVMIGTPEYISPEQVEGKEIDQRSDLYSLGIILYEMVTGKTPFEGDTALSIALKHKVEKPQDPRELNFQIPEDLNRVILKCLEKEKGKRYQSAKEVFSDLDKIEKEIPTRERTLSKKKLKVRTEKKRHQAIVVLGIFFLAAVIIIVGYFLFNRFFKFGETEWKSSIAVLPVEDLSLKKDQEPICLGLQDDIITKLSSIKELRVTSKLSVAKYKDMDRDIKEIGKELKVDNILVMSLQRERETIRVNGILFDAKQGFPINTYRYEQSFESYFKVQDDISNDIAQALEFRPAEDRLKVIKTREPHNVEAYVYFRTGMYFIESKYHGSYKEEDFDAGVRMYEKAFEIEPGYALAYWGLGNAYEARYNRRKDEKDYDLMLANYNKAYAINPDLAETNLGLGWVYFNNGDNDKAYQFFKKALELDSNNSIVNLDAGAFLRSIGLYRRAVKYFLKAIELDPSSMGSFRQIALCYMYIGEFRKAADQLKKVMEIEPDNVMARFDYVIQLIMMNKYDEAEKEIAIAEGIMPDNVKVQHHRAWICAARGEKEKALELLQGRTTYNYDTTSIYALLGMNDEAIRNIEEGIDRGFKERKDYLYSYPCLVNNPCYDELNHDPRFKEILEREKKKYEEKLKKYGKL